MDITQILISLVAGMALLMFLIMRTKIHAILALVATCVFVGVTSGLEMTKIPGVITSGFGGTLGGIGLVIGFGVMMGQIMEESNAAKVMARTFLKALKGKNEDVALAVTGFMVSIPIFADSGFIILSPLLKAISKVTKKSLVGLGVAMGMALALTHATVPPTPGPLGVAGIFGIDLGTFILFGLALGIPLMAVPVLCGKYFGRRYYKLINDEGEIYDVSTEEAQKLVARSALEAITTENPNEKMPSPGIAFAPILLPVVLILLNTILNAAYGKEPLPLLAQIFTLLGSPVVAVGIGLMLAIYGLTSTQSREATIDVMERGLKSAGMILLVTGAGGAFGQIIRATGAGDAIATALMQTSFPILLLPFLISGLLKFAQGSGTVAMITTASITMPILSQMPEVNLVYAAYAACIGSQLFSLFNDSYFWVVTRTIGLKKADEQVIAWCGTQFITACSGMILLLIVSAIF